MTNVDDLIELYTTGRMTGEGSKMVVDAYREEFEMLWKIFTPDEPIPNRDILLYKKKWRAFLRNRIRQLGGVVPVGEETVNDMDYYLRHGKLDGVGVDNRMLRINELFEDSWAVDIRPSTSSKQYKDARKQFLEYYFENTPEYGVNLRAPNTSEKAKKLIETHKKSVARIERNIESVEKMKKDQLMHLYGDLLGLNSMLNTEILREEVVIYLSEIVNRYNESIDMLQNDMSVPMDTRPDEILPIPEVEPEVMTLPPRESTSPTPPIRKRPMKTFNDYDFDQFEEEFYKEHDVVTLHGMEESIVILVGKVGEYVDLLKDTEGEEKERLQRFIISLQSYVREMYENIEELQEINADTDPESSAHSFSVNNEEYSNSGSGSHSHSHSHSSHSKSNNNSNENDFEEEVQGIYEITKQEFDRFIENFAAEHDMTTLSAMNKSLPFLRERLDRYIAALKDLNTKNIDAKKKAYAREHLRRMISFIRDYIQDIQNRINELEEVRRSEKSSEKKRSSEDGELRIYSSAVSALNNLIFRDVPTYNREKMLRKYGKYVKFSEMDSDEDMRELIIAALIKARDIFRERLQGHPELFINDDVDKERVKEYKDAKERLAKMRLDLEKLYFLTNKQILEKYKDPANLKTRDTQPVLREKVKRYLTFEIEKLQVEIAKTGAPIKDYIERSKLRNEYVKKVLLELKNDKKQKLIECGFCGLPGPQYKCEGCEKIHYCGTKCQRDHWKTTHRTNCQNIDYTE